MIAREVLPPRPSRRAIVALIALVAATGAVLCANFVAGERERAAYIEADGKLNATNYITYMGDAHLGHRDVTIGDGKGRDLTILTDAQARDYWRSNTYWLGESTPNLVMKASCVFVAWGVTLAMNVDYPQRHEHHDVVACSGGDLLNRERCLYFDEARTP